MNITAQTELEIEFLRTGPHGVGPRTGPHKDNFDILNQNNHTGDHNPIITIIAVIAIITIALSMA